MRNNKITRKRAAALAAKQSQIAGKLEDGTEVLKSKESRQKVRRWTFDAEVSFVIPQPKNEDGTTKVGEDGLIHGDVVMPPRRIRLEAISYCTAKEVTDDVKSHEASLHSTNQMFARAKIKVFAVPHETISNETLRQITGYRDMAMILDKALGLACIEAAQVVTGSAVGSQFIEAAAVEADAEKNIEAKPARTLGVIKEDFYKRAINEIKQAAEKANAETMQVETEANVQGTDGSQSIVLTDAGETGRQPFVPEIVEIKHTSTSSCEPAEAEL